MTRPQAHAVALQGDAGVGWEGGLAAAVAELPLQAQLASTAAEAVVVVAGAKGWPATAARALADGARAVIVVEPATEDTDALQALDERAKGAPIILDRMRLRWDVASDAAGSAPAPLTTARCAAASPVLADAIADTVGWLRVLTGGTLRLRSATATSRGALALFDTAFGAPATLTATALAGAGELRTDRGRISASAFGTERTEIELAAGRSARVIHDEGQGARVLPPRWETRGRLALRRAIAAVRTGERTTDLADFAHDVGLAARILPSA